MKEQDVFLKEIQKLHEDDFTKLVLLPLFKSMGYFDVHFNGGVVEEGKDLIAFKEGEFGSYTVTVVQSKKVREKAKLSVKKVHSYMLQLEQCLKKTVKYKDGKEYLPSKVYFASPFLINTRIIREQFEAIRNLDGKIEVIDGGSIYNQVKKVAPEIIDKFVASPTEKIASSVKELQNIELLRALRASEDPVKENFYSDLDFFVGKADSNTLLNKKICAQEKAFSLRDEEWIRIKRYVGRLCQNGILEPSCSVVESKYRDWKKKHEEKENQESIINIEYLDNEIEKAKQEMLVAIKGERWSIEKRLSEKDSCEPHSVDELHDARSALRLLSADVMKIELASGDHIKDKINDISCFSCLGASSIRLIENLAKSVACSIKERDDIKSQIVYEPCYEISVSSGALNKWWEEVGCWYRDSIREMNAGGLDHEEIRGFLEKIKDVLSVVNSMICVNEEIGPFFSLEDRRFVEDRISMSIQDIFNTGVNAALYGEAGAGKTTTLQVYSKNEIEKGDRSKNIYYFPLNRIVSANIGIDYSGFKDFKDYEKFFVYLLHYRRISDPLVSLTKTIRAISSRTRSVFIFDGIDEAIKTAPWIIKAINEIPQVISNCQVIVSSRDCVKYIDEIDFVGLTLLPFNESQLIRFIKGWIDDEEKAFKVVDDLRDRDIIHIVKNPLLATIICDLHKKGVEIPRSEVEIYRKRIRLLSGMYDNFKDIVRTVNSQDDLEEAARKIAFSLHVWQVRQASREKIIQSLVELSYGKFDVSRAELLFEELVNPCNILKKVPMENAYGFGHLRFQEHLAAEEISRKRDFDIVAATRSDWWSGVLYLYASENSIDGLVDDIYQRYGTLSGSEVSLMNMVSARGERERQNLGVLINRLIQQDCYIPDEIDSVYDDDARNLIGGYIDGE